jgi:hypothetical protein
MDGNRQSMTYHQPTAGDTRGRNMWRNLVVGEGKPLYSGQTLHEWMNEWMNERTNERLRNNPRWPRALWTGRYRTRGLRESSSIVIHTSQWNSSRIFCVTNKWATVCSLLVQNTNKWTIAMTGSPPPANFLLLRIAKPVSKQTCQYHGVGSTNFAKI